MSEQLRAALKRHLNLYDAQLDTYILKLEKCNNHQILIDVIERLARENKGKKLVSFYDIKNAYFGLFKKPEQATEYAQTRHGCGVYCGDTGKHIKNTAPVVPCLDMRKVGLENPRECPDYCWTEDSAYEYVWACYEMATGKETKPISREKTNNLPIPKNLVQPVKNWQDHDIWENEAVNG